MRDGCEAPSIPCELPRMKRHHRRGGVTVVCQRSGCNKLFKAEYVAVMGDAWYEWAEIERPA